ncbi:MAG: hypothetical protein WBX22_01640, partial [Silvibacterium sp.]
MSKQKIPTTLIQTYITEYSQVPVKLYRVSEFPESYLTARRIWNREKGKVESETEEYFIWFPDWKNSKTLRPRDLLPPEVIGAGSANDPKLKPVDPFIVRDQFLEITEPSQGLRFFQKYGVLGEEHWSTFNFQAGLFVSDVRRWQDVFKQCWLSDPVDWPAIVEDFSGLWKIERILHMPDFSLGAGEYDHLRLRCRCVREVIMAAVWFDKLAQRKTSVCRRVDCDNL